MNITQLRKLAGAEEVDYGFSMAALSDYARPRDKVTTWLKSGELIRVKKGLYVFGPDTAIEPYSKEKLANLIYGPSAVSLSYALSFYGMIPERVQCVTSITHKRNKQFSTPIGEFSYQYLAVSKYFIGIDWLEIRNGEHILIASPEKALCDHIHLTDRILAFDKSEAMEKYLLNDLRVDGNTLGRLRVKVLMELVGGYRDQRLQLLVELIRKWRKR